MATEREFEGRVETIINAISVLKDYTRRLSDTQATQLTKVRRINYILVAVVSSLVIVIALVVFSINTMGKNSDSILALQKSEGVLSQQLLGDQTVRKDLIACPLIALQLGLYDPNGKAALADIARYEDVISKLESGADYLGCNVTRRAAK